MKGLFLGQRRFVVIAHAIATSLKNKYNIQDFCIYTFSRSNLKYLTQQTDIKYQTILLDEDVHNLYKDEPLDTTYLQWLEKEYGIPNLWVYLAIDRVLMYNQFLREYPYNTPQYSHEEMMRILQVTAKKIIKLFDEEKPNFVFMSVVGAVGSMLIYHIAKKRSIPVFVGVVGRIGHLFLLSENYHDTSWADTIFEDFQKKNKPNTYFEQAQKILSDFRTNPTPYDEFESPAKKEVNRKKQLKFLHPKNILKSISWFATFCRHYFENAKNKDYDEIKPWHYLVDHTKRKIRCLIGFDDLYDHVDSKDEYVFFPLQLEPEISTLLYAPFFIDQLYVIRQIARSLPLNFKLYIKEHPTMVGYRPRSYYREIKKIPNVKLISPQIMSFPLIKDCRLVATITSTVGWEALFLKKPVVTLGEVFYNKLSMVKCCKTIEQLPYIIKDQLEHFYFNEEELINYVSALLADGIEVPLVSLWERELDNLEKINMYSEKIADLIVKKLNYQ